MCLLKTCTAILAAAAGAVSASAQSHVFTLEGVEIPALPDQPAVFEFEVTGGGFFEDLSFTVDLTMFDPSWGSELNIELAHLPTGYLLTLDGSDDNAGDLAPADIVLGFGDAPGDWHFANFYSPLPHNVYDVSGIWTLTVYDESNSLAGPEGILDAEFVVYVPAPAAAGLLGFAGLIAMRRRR